MKTSTPCSSGETGFPCGSWESYFPCSGGAPSGHDGALAAAGGSHEPCGLAGGQDEGDPVEHLARTPHEVCVGRTGAGEA